MEDVLKERGEQAANQETVPAKEVREETKEVKVERGKDRVFLSNKGAEVFKKSLDKKGFVEERGFRKLVSPFKEIEERKGWKAVCKHVEPGKRALVKEF